MRLWALVGASTGELLSYRGAVMVHEDRAELEYLVPGTRTVEVPADLGQPLMALRDHPDMAAVTWPLDRRDFR